MRAPAIPTESIPRTTVTLWHDRLVTVDVAMTAALATIAEDGALEALHCTLALCAAELRRVNLALEVVGMEWDLETSGDIVAACRADGLLPPE